MVRVPSIPFLFGHPAHLPMKPITHDTTNHQFLLLCRVDRCGREWSIENFDPSDTRNDLQLIFTDYQILNPPIHIMHTHSRTT